MASSKPRRDSPTPLQNHESPPIRRTPRAPTQDGGNNIEPDATKTDVKKLQVCVPNEVHGKLLDFLMEHDAGIRPAIEARMEALRAQEKELRRKRDALKSELAAKEALFARQTAMSSRMDAFTSRVKEFRRRDMFLDNELLWSIEDNRYRTELLEFASCYETTKVLEEVWPLLERKEKPNSWIYEEGPSAAVNLLQQKKERFSEPDVSPTKTDIASAPDQHLDEDVEEEIRMAVAKCTAREAEMSKAEDELDKDEAALAIREKEWSRLK